MGESLTIRSVLRRNRADSMEVVILDGPEFVPAGEAPADELAAWLSRCSPVVDHVGAGYGIQLRAMTVNPAAAIGIADHIWVSANLAIWSCRKTIPWR